MPFNDGCWRRRRVALGLVTIWLSGCATAGSDTPPGACPPVVEYNRAEQARLAKEVAALSEGLLIVTWLAEYAVLRDQARACAGR